MESPVRICLGAALVVSILVLSATTVGGNALPLETTSVTTKDQKTQRHKINATGWTVRSKQRTPDISLNELNAKESISEETTEKHLKFSKSRGRVKFQAQPSTESSLRRVRSTEGANLIIVTPTAEVKRPAEIIDSMKTYKKTKMPVLTSSTTPVSVTKEAQSLEEEYEDEEEEEDKESFEKYTSSKFHDSNFFTIPGFTDDGYSYEPHGDNSERKEKLSYSSPSYSSFPNFFPEDTSFGYKNEHDTYKSESYFNFDSELTTPKNDFFDKKYTEISKSIITKLDAIKAKSPPINTTKIVTKENLGLDRLGNNIPTNKSTVFIKNTKEIRLSDNEKAGTDNTKGLSDVQGTSIYYEMSVLSTETYNINSDDDCDNDTTMLDPTASTSAEEELASLRATQLTFPEATKPTFPAFTELSMPKRKKSHEESTKFTLPKTTKRILVETTKETLPEINGLTSQSSTKTTVIKSKTTYPASTKTAFSKSADQGEASSTKITIPITSVEPSFSKSNLEPLSTFSSDFLPISSVLPIFNSVTPFPISTQNSMTSTDRITRIFSSSFSRNRNYSKRLNLSGNNDSPNSVTPKPEFVSTNRPLTRKFHHTTPKNRPVWMAPRRNMTFIRTTSPRTIYSEHFSIKDKYTTTQGIKTPSKTTLTTVSSEIDPVLQSEVSGTKKVVHSPSISDNSIPSLWKRGSTRFKTSTATSAEVESEMTEMEIPPTSVAWALVSLKSPPVLSSTVNVTGSTQKPVDENELQKVGEAIDNVETTAGTAPTTVTNSISNDIITKKVTDVDQNLPWQPVYASTSPSSDGLSETAPTESKSERLATESNIQTQSSVETPTSEAKLSESPVIVTNSTPVAMKDIKPLWAPPSTVTIEQMYETETETIQPVDATKSTGFESITKLPSDVTTPTDETAAESEVTQTITDEKPETTTDYAITTIRFSYNPVKSDTVTMNDKATTPSIWHPIFPTRTKATTIKDEPITTYRPAYLTTTDSEMYTTMSVETTPTLEISSQVVDVATESLPSSTETDTTTEELISTTDAVTTNIPLTTTTNKPTTTAPTTAPTTVPTTTVPTTTEMETTTIIVEVVTEINSERTKISSEAPVETTTELDFISEENSGSNEVITHDSIETTTTPSPTTLEVTTEAKVTTHATVTTQSKLTTQENAKLFETTTFESTETTTYFGTKAMSDLEDANSYAGDVTTSSSQIVIGEEEGSGAAVAIAVSTIGVIALIMLIGLLLVVRRRGRRGIYAQRCTPVSLDAYSLDSVSVGHRKGNHRLRASKRSFGNPAYDDEVTSHPMQYAALANFALDIESITAEFAEIPSVIVRPDEVPPGCEDKNRYSNVLPLPETRVPLKRIGNDPTTEYINANFITGPGNIRNYYIACQAPLSNTVVDFWRMIWEQNSRLVVMLTEYMENGVEKCYEYLPPSEITDNKRIFGDFKIILKKREQRDKYAVSSVQLINLGTRTWREVTHLWYFWPAKGVPEDYDSVIDFLSEMRSYMKIAQTAKEYDEDGVEVIYGDQSRSSFNNLSKLREESGSGNGVNVYSPAQAEEQMRRGTNGTLGRMKAASEVDGIRPCVVTCASGAGRAAALVALDVSARALGSGAADVPRVVRELRRQRPHALANRHHYIFLYKVLSEYGHKMMGGGVDTI